MKKWFIIAGIVLFVFAGLYLVFSFFAVKFIESRIQKTISPGFTIARIKGKITHLSIHEIRFEDPQTLQVEEMRIYPDLIGFLKRKFIIRELVVLKPSFFLYRTQGGTFVGPWISMQHQEEVSSQAVGKGEKKNTEPVPIKINLLRVEKGSIDFEDRKMGDPPGQVYLREVGLNIEHIEYPPVSARSQVDLKGKIKGKVREGEIVAKGWIDLWASDLEASLKIRETDLRVFEPYYRKRVSAEVESGYVNMEGHLSVKKRALDTAGKLEVTDLQIKDAGAIFYIPAKTLRSQLWKRGNRAEVQFHVKGNLDDSRFNLQEVLLVQIGFGLAEAIGFPIKTIGRVDKEKTN
jgi:hypothetical protein